MIEIFYQIYRKKANVAGNTPRHFDGGKGNGFSLGMWIKYRVIRESPRFLFTYWNGKGERYPHGKKKPENQKSYPQFGGEWFKKNSAL